MPAPALAFENVHYTTPTGHNILDGITFALQSGETLALLGRSGCGKTTTLRLANALLTPSAGHVSVAGRDLSAWNAIELRRKTGYVIQEAGLFPHYTVAQNIALVPRLLGWDEGRISTRTRELMDVIGLAHDTYVPRFPRALSGGERQRVGLARALAADPPLILMDEPFAALDPMTCLELRRDFSRWQRRLGKSALLVTHDLGTALDVGQKVALMSRGRIAFLGTPTEFLHSDLPEAVLYRESALPQGGQLS